MMSDMKELDENVEYEERESEFDQEDEDRDKDPELGRAREGEQDAVVDVVSVDPIPQLLSRYCICILHTYHNNTGLQVLYQYWHSDTNVYSYIILLGVRSTVH